MINNPQIQQLLIIEINKILDNFYNTNNLNRGYYHQIIDNEDVKNAVKNNTTVESLLEHYRKRSGISSKEIKELLKIDFSGFIKYLSFQESKASLYALNVLFQLNKEESDEVLNSASILLKTKVFIHDCVYNFYINNYQKKQNALDNYKEYEEMIIWSKNYFSEQVKVRGF